jgi:hypothetical protein
MMPTASPPESTIVAAIVKWLGTLPATRVVKTHGDVHRRGEPDLYILCEGTFIALEVKRPGEPHPVTPLQAATLAKWRAAGAVTGVVRSLDEAQAIVSDARLVNYLKTQHPKEQ